MRASHHGIRLAAIGCLFLLATSVARAAEEACATAVDDVCTLYLAPSTIPQAGLGLFTAIERDAGDEILPASREICLPWVDLYWHQPTDFRHPQADALWHGHGRGMRAESATGTVEASCPGLGGAALNCHAALANLVPPSPLYHSGPARSQSAGAGAQSPYGVAAARVARKIPAGGEVFLWYGDDWWTTRMDPGSDFYDRPADYAAAAALLEEVTELLAASTSSSETTHDDVAAQVKALVQQVAPTVLEVLPQTIQKCLQTTAQAAGTDAASLQRMHTQSPSWLQAHGRCVDGVVGGQPSTLPDAGLGAFARRKVKAGQVISTSPLHHLVDESVMDMYPIEKKDFVPPSTKKNDTDGDEAETEGDKADVEEQHRYVRHTDRLHTSQIALNYCFGRGDSSLLLCPYGPGVNYLNHHAAPNVEVRWATDFAGHDAKLLETVSLEALQELPPQFALDYVALRDIEVGEELFLDYGTDWEDAWTTYQEEWEKEERTSEWKTYRSAHVWNDLFADTMLRTPDEQLLDSYPSHLDIRCHANVVALRSSLPADYPWTLTDYGVPCTLLDRFLEDGQMLYTVDIELRPAVGLDNLRPETTEVRLMTRTDLPREAFRFFDAPGTSELTRTNTFRRWISLPEGLYPEQWNF
jgi:hypothetical protein